MQVWSRKEWQVGNVARTRVSEYWHRVRRLTGVSTRADLCSSRVSESCVHLESLHFKTGAVFSTDYLERVNETRAWGRVHCHVWRRRTKASVVDNRKGFFFFPSQLWLDRVPIWLGKSHFQQQVGWGTRLPWANGDEIEDHQDVADDGPMTTVLNLTIKGTLPNPFGSCDLESKSICRLEHSLN